MQMTGGELYSIVSDLNVNTGITLKSALTVGAFLINPDISSNIELINCNGIVLRAMSSITFNYVAFITKQYAFLNIYHHVFSNYTFTLLPLQNYSPLGLYYHIYNNNGRILQSSDKFLNVLTDKIGEEPTKIISQFLGFKFLPVIFNLKRPDDINQ